MIKFRKGSSKTERESPEGLEVRKLKGTIESSAK